MGSKTINPVTPLLTGAALTKTDSAGTTSTIVVAATTAQSALDLSKLSVIFENYSTTESCVITLAAGANYSEIGQGAAAAITLATGASCIIGGKDLESARFLNASDQISFTITTAATVYVYATMPGQNDWN